MDPSPDFGQLLERLEQRGGDFLVSGGDTWSASYFADQVRRAAGGLQAAGVGPGDRVLLNLEKGPELVLGLWAAIRIGAVAVPVHPKLRRDQVAHVVRDANPTAVLTSATRELLLSPDPEELWVGRSVWGHGQGPSLGSLREGDASAPHQAVDSDAPAIFLYSSGSTGAPKAIVQSQRTLVDGARIVAGYLGLSDADTVLAALPLSFDYGLNQVLAAAWSGARVVLRDYLGPADLATVIRDHGITVLAGVPTLWRDLTEWLEDPAAAEPLQSLRVLTNTGGRWDTGDIRNLRAHFPRAALHSMYGLTEAFRSATLDPAEIDAFPDSIGRAVPEVTLDLVDDDGCVVDGPGTGELVHTGAFVGLGYWNREADTAVRFRAHPLDSERPAVWSGDIVRRDAEGRLFFEGRRDDQLKVDGHRVSPEEVSDALRTGLGLRHVAVVGLDDGVRGHRLVACVADAVVEDDVVRAWSRAHLPPHLQPARILRVAELPRTPNGKIDRQALLELARRS